VTFFLVMIPVARVPFATVIYVMTAITVAVTNPMPGPAVDFVSMVFGLFPALIPIAVALDAYAMIPIGVASLIGVSDNRR
jgi:hypothetical protein